MYVKGVKRSSKYTVKAVMLYMQKVLKETQNTIRAHNIFAHNFFNIQPISIIPLHVMYVKCVKGYFDLRHL